MTAHTIVITRGDQATTTVDADEPISGLRIYRLPDWVDPTSPYRWRLGHHSGAVIAAGADEAAVHAGAAALADVTDWTAGMAAINAAVSPADQKALYASLRTVGCYHAGEARPAGIHGALAAAVRDLPQDDPERCAATLARMGMPGDGTPTTT
jgi:hypothetical protein